MQMTIKLSANDVISLIAQMGVDEIEKIKKALIKQEIYFQKFQKAPVNEIVEDFSKCGYSSEFLSDLENGLKKSSVYQ